MRKLIALFGITVMALAAILPVMAARPGGDDATGSITYQTGGVIDPAKIVAIWEFVGAESVSPLDDDLTYKGCQVNPPMVFDQYSTVWVYVAFHDPDNDITDTDQIKVDISWPNNGLRPELGNGGKKADNIEPVEFTTWSEFLAAHSIDNGLNFPFICFYDGAKDGSGLEEYAYVEHLYLDSNSIKIAKVPYQLYYHDPAGWYDAEVTIQGTFIDTQKNYFEYVLLNGIEFDFTNVDWGNENQINLWHDAPGDFDFSTADQPTVRNIGNWDSRLGVHFTAGSFNPADVRFDVRIGDENPASPHFNQSYRERTTNPIPPDVDRIPMPIDNNLELATHFYDDTLLKCHTAKLIFYLRPTQWTNGPGVYTFNIEMYSEIPSTWLPFEDTVYPYPPTAS